MSCFLTNINQDSAHTKSKQELNQAMIQIESKFINYITVKETKYADMIGIESKLLKTLDERNSKFNANKVLIQKGREKNDSLSSSLTSEILAYYNLSKISGLPGYDDEISKGKYGIKLKTHEQETYENSYDRLYKAQMKLQIRIENEIKYEEKYTQQFNKYQILKNHGLGAVNTKHKNGINMRNYSNEENLKFKFELIKKADIIHDLNFKLKLLNKQMKKTDKQGADIKQESKEMNLNIIKENSRNNMLYTEYKWNLVKYYELKVKLNRVYSYVKINNIEDLIFKLNKLKAEYQSLHSQFLFENNEVTNGNKVLTGLCYDLDYVKGKIRSKYCDRPNSLISNPCDLDNASIRVAIGVQKEKKLSLMKLMNKYDEKKYGMQIIVDFMIKYINQINSKINGQTFTQRGCTGKSGKQRIWSSSLPKEEKEIDSVINSSAAFSFNMPDQESLCKVMQILSHFANGVFLGIFTTITNIITGEDFMISNHTGNHNKIGNQKKRSMIGINIGSQSNVNIYTDLVINTFKDGDSLNKKIQINKERLRGKLAEEEKAKREGEIKNQKISDEELLLRFKEYINKEDNGKKGELRDKSRESISDSDGSEKQTLNNIKRDIINSLIPREDGLADSSESGQCKVKPNQSIASTTWFSKDYINKTFLNNYPNKVNKILRKYQNDSVDHNTKNTMKYINPGASLNKSQFNKGDKKPVNNKKAGKTVFTYLYLNNKSTKHTSNHLSYKQTKNSSDILDGNPPTIPIIFRSLDEEYFDDSTVFNPKQSTLIVTNKTKQYRNFKFDKERAEIFNRDNDGRKLEFTYCKDESEKYENVNYYGVYFNFKKKFLTKAGKSMYNNNTMSKTTINIMKKDLSQTKASTQVDFNKGKNREKTIKNMKREDIIDEYSGKKNKKSKSMKLLNDLKGTPKGFHVNPLKNSIITSNLANLLNMNQ